MRTLTDDERDHFRRNGFVVLPGVLDPERLALMRSAVEQAAAERDAFQEAHPECVARMRDAEARGDVIHPTEWAHVVMQNYQLWERVPPMRAHSLDPVLAEIARAAMGTGPLRLWFDQAMTKMPGDGPTPFHQDNAYMPVDREAGGVVTIWAPLTEVTAEMGCLHYVPGSHETLRLRPIPLIGFDDVADLLPDPAMLGQAVPAEVPEGGVVLHHGDVLHGAGPNTTDLPRAAILTCYFPDGSRRRGTLAQWMADRHHVRPGDRLVGPGLPLIGEA